MGTIENVADFVKQMTGLRKSPNRHVDLKSFALEIANTYRVADPEDRQRIREMLQPYPAVTESLVSIAESLAASLDGPADAETLGLAYVLVSINDQRIDYRELTLALGALHNRGLELGLPVSQQLIEAAALSSDVPSAMSGKSTSEMLGAEANRLAGN